MEANIRPATPADTHALAELVNMAGEGLPLYLWTRMAEPGEDPWEVGSQRALRDSGGFSWRNATVLAAEGQAAACLIGYSLPNEPEPIDPGMPPMTLQEGTWKVEVWIKDDADVKDTHDGDVIPDDP